MKLSKADFTNKPTSLYNGCISEWWPAIDANKKVLNFKKGELIFREGEPVLGMYFMVTGVVKVHKHWIEDKELIIRFASENDYIGHRGLSTNHDVYPISATTLVESTICFLDLNFFNATLKVNPDFMFRFLLFFADELRLSEQRMRDLAHMPVKERVMKTLITIQTKFGTDANGFINFDISRQDIAAYTGAAYETVYKILAEFTGSNLIKTDGKRIGVIPQPLNQ